MIKPADPSSSDMKLFSGWAESDIYVLVVTEY